MWRRNITVMFSTFLFGWLASAVNSIKFYFGLLALSRHTKGIILFSEKTTVSRSVNMFHLDKKSILLSNSDFFLRLVFNLSGLRSRCMHYLAPTYGSVLWGNNYEDPLSQLFKLQYKVSRKNMRRFCPTIVDATIGMIFLYQ